MISGKILHWKHYQNYLIHLAYFSSKIRILWLSRGQNELFSWNVFMLSVYFGLCRDGKSWGPGHESLRLGFVPCCDISWIVFAVTSSSVGVGDVWCNSQYLLEVTERGSLFLSELLVSKPGPWSHDVFSIFMAPRSRKKRTKQPVWGSLYFPTVILHLS